MSTEQKNTKYLQEGDCIAYPLPSGEYGGAVVCRVYRYRDLHNYFLLITDVKEAEVPEMRHFKEASTFGREVKSYLDDVLLIWEKRMPGFYGKFIKVGQVSIDPEKIHIGAFRHQTTFFEFEESVRRIAIIDYLERKPYPISSLIKEAMSEEAPLPQAENPSDLDPMPPNEAQDSL